MGSHSVTCHLTQVNAPRLTPVMQAGTRFTYSGGMECWVDLVDSRPGVELATFRSRVRRPTTALPRQSYSILSYRFPGNAHWFGSNLPLLFTSANLHSQASPATVQVRWPLCSCLINNSPIAVEAIFLAVSRRYSVRADIVNHVRLPGADNRLGSMPITNPIATRRVCGARYGFDSFVSHVTDHVIEHRPPTHNGAKSRSLQYNICNA